QLTRAGFRLAAIGGFGVALAALYCRGFAPFRDVIAVQVQHNANGHGGTFLLGAWSDVPLRSYFPTLLTIKLPVPLLILPILIACIRPRALANWPFAAAGIILLASLTCRIQIGIRYLLPCLAFAIVGIAVAGVSVWQWLPAGWFRRGYSLGTG